MRILLVEDDAILANALKQSLVQGGYAVDCASDGIEANQALMHDSYDCVLLDLGLPKLDGFEVIRQVRARKVDTPILIMTARDALSDRVRGLDLGADDYLIKPFAVPELEARVRALVRRKFGATETTLSLGPLEANSANRQASVQGNSLDLSPREFAALEALLLKAGRVVSKEHLASHLYGWGDEVTDNAIEVCIFRLRKKLAPHDITVKTVRGLGYLLDKLDNH